MELFISMLVFTFPLVFTNNLLMSFVKIAAAGAIKKPWLRALLAILSIFGSLAASSLSGEPVNFNLISDWARLILESLVLYTASHYSYRVIKEAQ